MSSKTMRTLLPAIAILLLQSACSREYTGRVIDRDGAPVAGAKIERITHPGIFYPTIKHTQVAETNEDGEFTFTSIGQPKGSLYAKKGDLVGGLSNKALAPTGNVIEVR